MGSNRYERYLYTNVLEPILKKEMILIFRFYFLALNKNVISQEPKVPIDSNTSTSMCSMEKDAQICTRDEGGLYQLKVKCALEEKEEEIAA